MAIRLSFIMDHGIFWVIFRFVVLGARCRGRVDKIPESAYQYLFLVYCTWYLLLADAFSRSRYNLKVDCTESTGSISSTYFSNRSSKFYILDIAIISATGYTLRSPEAGVWSSILLFSQSCIASLAAAGGRQ